MRFFKLSILVILSVTILECNPSPKKITISGIEVNLISAERLDTIVEGSSEIRSDENQEFLKVVLSLKAIESVDAIEEFYKWDISLVEANGEESGPAFGWRFSDPDNSTVWIYSYPKDVNTQYQGIKIENVILPLQIQ